MKEKINDIELQENIDGIFPILPIITKKEKISLFFSKKEKVFYSLYTDGDLEHINTWLDKRPYDKDAFLQGCSTVKRFDFYLTYANILIVEKNYQNHSIRNLYLNQDYLYKVINNQIYQISINEKENIKIKKMER